MFLPKVEVCKMAKLSGFTGCKMVNNVNGGGNPVIEENSE